MKKRARTCIIKDCLDEPFMGGRCETHYKEYKLESELRNDAINVLHTGAVDGRLPDNPTLRKELLHLCKWWQRACSVVQNHRDTNLLSVTDANDVIALSISASKEILEAERAFRSGEQIDDIPSIKRSWAVERMQELEDKKQV